MTPAPRVIRRLTSSEKLPTICGEQSTSNKHVGQDSCTMLLRPRLLKMTGSNDDFKGSRIIDNEKLMDAMNQVYQEHKRTGCEDGNFSIAKNEKWGLGWKYAFKCEHCEFQSETYKNV